MNRLALSSLFALVAAMLTLLAAGCSLRDVEEPPDGTPDGITGCCTESECADIGRVCNETLCVCEPADCCDAATCAAEGKACNPTTCQCEATSCCTEPQCQATNKTCNTTTCVCEVPTCCTDASCAATSQLCNRSTCACEAPPCCTDSLCSTQGKVCNATSCQCEAPVCCTDAQCRPNGDFCNTATCVCEECCDDFECRSQGKVCNQTTCQCETETTCCTDAQCAQTGKVCNTTSCLCETPTCCSDATCAPQGKVCNATSCQCETPPCCTQALCQASGQVCNTVSCNCVDPAPQPCTQAGNPCDPNATQNPAWVCVESGNSGVCRNFCQMDLNNPTDPCAQGSYCKVPSSQPGPTVYGYCEPSECNGFFDNNCPTGQKCVPNRNRTRICVPLGSGAEGAACSDIGDCAANLLCVGGTCQRPDCGALSGTPACGSGEECSGLVLGTELIDVGFCYTPCIAFKTPDTCGAGRWCYPLTRNANGTIDGECTAYTGTGAVGTACTGQTCRAGLLCIGGTCEQLCDPQVTSGDGTCPSRQGCGALLVDDGAGGTSALDFGTCYDSCDFHANQACVNSTLACVPGELIDLSFDFCMTPPSVNWPLDEGESCWLNGYDEYEICNNNSVCLWDGFDVVCMDLCFTSEGAFNSSPHPDCRVSARTCSNAFGVTDFGLCE